MKNKLALVLLLLFLSGCASYKIQRGKQPYDKGYVASKDSYTILEYTVGKNNDVPADERVAEDRLKRRRKAVEGYYQKMGYLESRVKEVFLNPPIYLVKFIGGIFRLPFIIAADHKYNHDPKYKEQVDKLEEEADEKEQARIKVLRSELDGYIQKDLAGEPASVEALLAKASEEDAARKSEEAAAAVSKRTAPVAQEKPAEAPVQEAQGAVQQESPAAFGLLKEDAQSKALEEKELAAKAAAVKPKALRAQARQEAPSVPVAVITAAPLKGQSPLRVRFGGGRSHSTGARIVSYSWDFGDGDTSSKKDPLNTYWSTTYGSRYFTATLTVRDSQGNTATASAAIEVTTK